MNVFKTCLLLMLFISNSIVLLSQAHAETKQSAVENTQITTPSDDNANIYEYLPGFGGITEKQINNIHPQFISSIYAGFVSGLTSGFIVGVVIFLIQKWSETRQLRQKLDREVSIFKEEVRNHLECVDAFALHDIEVMPESAKSIVLSLKNHPVDLWQEHLPERKAFIDKLKEFQAAAFKFRSAANKFDNRLWSFIRKYNSSNNAVSFGDPPIYVYCVGKLIGLSDAEIIPYMESFVNKGELHPTVTTCFNKVINDEELKILSSEYLDKRKMLKEILTEIRVQLGVQSA